MNKVSNTIQHHLIESAKKGAGFIFDLIFPLECLGCGKEGSWLCDKCFKKLETKSSQYCLHCKKRNNYGEFCQECKTHYYLNGIWIAGDYENLIISKLIKNLKYRFVKNISKTLGSYISIFLQSLLNKNRLTNNDIKNGIIWRKFNKLTYSPECLLNFNDNLVVPVPLHEKRRRWRGFNQSEVISEFIANNFNLELDAKNLILKKHKKAQAKLGEAERKSNIKDCFRWQGDNLNKKNIILIDDVTTTGSTLNECAKILKENNAGEVWGLVVAKG